MRILSATILHDILRVEICVLLSQLESSKLDCNKNQEHDFKENKIWMAYLQIQPK